MFARIVPVLLHSKASGERRLLSCNALDRLLRDSLRFGILATEALNAARSVHQLLLAGKKRMAIRADFQVNVALMSGAGRKSVSARANHSNFVIVRMNTLFRHDSKNLSLQSLYFTEIMPISQ